MLTVSKAVLKLKQSRKSRLQVVCENVPPESVYRDHMNKYKIFSCRTMQKIVLDECQTGINEKMEPVTQTVFGAVLFADISGFTRLSASLNAEELKFHINQYFSMLLGIVDKNHGDVVKFCGDAVIVMWPIDIGADDDTKCAAIKMAIICGFDLLASCGKYDHKMNSGSETVSLRLHCGISCGPIHCMCLGYEDRWEFLISGAALRDVGAAEAEASLGEICIAGFCYRFVENIFEGIHRSNGVYFLTGRLVGHDTLRHIENFSGVISRRDVTDDTSITCTRESVSGHSNVPSESDEISLTNSAGTDNSTAHASSKKTTRIGAGSGRIGTRNRHRSSLVDALTRVAAAMYLVHKESKDHQEFDAPMDESVLESEITVRSTRASLSHRIKDFADQEVSTKHISLTDRVDLLRSALNMNSDENITRAINFIGNRQLIDRVLYESSEEVAAKIRLFVPEPARVAIENRILSHLAELRVVVTLFMEVLGLEDDFDRGISARPLKVISLVQSSLKRYGGTLRQYVVDDKGCVIIAAFGLPGSAHEDNSVRAIETAVRIRHFLNEESISCRFGITQGLVYCGLVGHGDRCEYAMMGASVNLAARFMSQAGANDIVVGENIQQDCLNDFLFCTLSKVKAKGYAKPVAAFTPTERLRQGAFLSTDWQNMKDTQENLVERKAEIKILTSGLDDFIATGSRNMFIVNGPVGIGKTWLFSKFHVHVSKNCPEIKQVTIYSASTHHTNSRYYCLRHLIDQVLGISNVKHERMRQSLQVDTVINSGERTKLLSASLSLVGEDTTQECVDITSRALICWLRDNATHITVKDLDIESEVYSSKDNETPDLCCEVRESGKLMVGTSAKLTLSADTSIVELIPLLAAILPIEVDQSDLCQMIGHWARTKLCIAMIVKILKMTVLSRDHILLVENLQWCDLPSLEILCKLITTSDSGFFLGTMRTHGGAHATVDNSYSEVTQNDLNLQFQMSECSPTTQKFVAQMLRACVACTLHPLTTDEIRGIMELSIPERFLRTRPELLRPNSILQVIIRTDGKPYLTSAFILTLRDSLVNGRFIGLEYLPSGEQNIIIHRFDKLDSKQQALLKVASVIGDTFSYEFLVNVLREMGMQDSIPGLHMALSRLLHSTLIIAVSMTDDIADKDDGENSGDERYKFTTKNVRYSIYNLMLSTQKESTHDVIGKLLEKRHSKFDHIAKHFFRSNNIPKMLAYLQESIYRARVNNDLYVAKSLLKRLLTLATGMDVDELLAYCCRNKQDRGKTFAADKSSQLKSLERRKLNPDDVNLGKQWIATKKFHLKFVVNDLKTVEDDSTGPIADPFKRTIDTGNKYRVLSQAPASRLVDSNAGEFCEQSWMTSPIRSIGPELHARLGNIRLSHNLCLLAHSNLGVSAVEVDSEENVNSIRYRAKEWWAEMSGVPTVENESTLLEVMKSHLILAQAHILRGRAPSAWASLNMVTRVARSCKNVETRFHLVHMNALSVLLALYGGESMARLDARMLQLDDTVSKISVTSESLGVFYIVHSILQSSNGAFEDAIQYSLRASVYFERAEASMFLYGSIVYRGWLFLLSGNAISADRNITEASQLAITNGICGDLHKWVVELKVVYNCLMGNIDEALTDWETLRSINKRDTHTATSSALMAHLLIRKGQWVEAVSFAKYACTRLAQKMSTTIVSTVFLFYSGHSALSIMEEVRHQVEAIENRTVSPLGRSDLPSLRQLGLPMTDTQIQEISSTSAGRAIIAQLELCVNNVIDALRKDCNHIRNSNVLLQTLLLMRKRFLKKSHVSADKIPDLGNQPMVFSFGRAFYDAERVKFVEGRVVVSKDKHTMTAPIKNEPA